jgi:hypothetical protein
MYDMFTGMVVYDKGYPGNVWTTGHEERVYYK